ncbi:uncharacterized protein mslna isoform X2 [Megalobrama amblycephala]|uniref:uncharacterized protein mslna isoform X2 n=1 Tax=Megalobrama amblycephala TaxID=75352 RepID=UPI002013CE1B|nr:uncharacterized protein mslna isoform X2 [Megalobrama amblycephala]
MVHFQLSVLFGLGLITLINGQCVVNFQNGIVSNNGSSCSSFSPSTLSNIVSCSAILSDSPQGNVNLKAFTDSAFDLYTLLRSKLDVGLVASSINSVRSNGSIVGTLSDASFAKLWFQVKLSPYLSSLSRDTLSCLSQSNLTCQSFQALLNDLSLQIGTERQRLVYQNFIKPFLARNTANGTAFCTSDFNWRVALDKLTPEQKAELFFQLEASSSLNNDNVDQIFKSLQPLTSIKIDTTRATSNDSDKTLTDFILLLKPLGRFINSSAIIAPTTNVNLNLRNTTINLLVNWTNLKAPSEVQISTINISNVSDWLQTVVAPLTKTYLHVNQTLPVNITAMLNVIFDPAPQSPDPVELCKVTSNNSSCLISQSGESLAKAINCVAQSNLSFTEENLRLLTAELSKPLQTQIEQSVKNSSQSNLIALFAELPAESFTSGNLDDVEFMRFWFQIKMKPLLPNVSKEFLSCLRTRNFSCQAYKALFVELNNNSGLMDSVKQTLILNDFIVPFLSQRQSTGIDCTLPFISSSDFVLQNFGNFFPLAQLQVISNLSRSFSALDALSLLSLAQLDELVFSPAFAANRTNILTSVFDFLIKTAPKDTVNSFLRSLQTKAPQTNFTCANYRTIFDKVDQVLLSVPSNQSEALLTIRDFVMMIPPDECIERASQCTTTPLNESPCASVNSSALDQFLRAAPNATGPLNLCNFTVLEFACLPTVSQLSSQKVAEVLACKRPSNVGKETWKLFFSKTITNLDDALLKFSNMTPSPSNVSLSDVLDVLVDVRVDRFSPQRLKDPVFIRSWFQGRLKPFLPSVSQRVLSCLSQKNLSCESYSVITEAFVNAPLRDGQDVCLPLQPNATQRQDQIYTEFMKAFLSRNDTEDPRCLRNTTNSTQWINRNFGPFVQSALLTDLVALNKNFTAVDVLPLLGLKQLVEFSASPGALTDPGNVSNVMQFVKDCQLPAFFDLFSLKLQVNLTQDVKAALIKQIFDRVNLSNLTIPDQEVVAWFTSRIKPLLANLSESLVSPLFSILNTRNCNITQTTLRLLDPVGSSIATNTKNAIYNGILQSFRVPQPLRCYRNNSFITFLNESLSAFGPLPNLTIFLSLMPQPRRSELVNSISPSELGSYFTEPKVVNNDSQICVIFNNFNRTTDFLENVEVPDDVKSSILPCVWPLALTTNNQTEVDLWFDRRLRLYLKFLNKDIIGSKETLSASCLSYRKMFTFNGSQISSGDVYTTIKTYLKADTAPKCFNSSDPSLNSTAWFVNNIGMFITFMSLDDLYSFGSDTTMQLFTVNPENIKLFGQKTIPRNVLNRYTELLFRQNINFNLFELPSVLQCDAPVSTFTKLNESQTNTILLNFNSSCSIVDPAISTALAGNIKDITADAIINLGNKVVGLKITQINLVPPSVLISGLSTLSAAPGWSFGKAKAVMNVILKEYKFAGSSSLLNLGSLIGGIPSTILTTIKLEDIKTTLNDTVFVKNLLVAPEIIQKTFVTQIIKLSSSPVDLMTNIPNEMAVQIPRNLLTIPTTLNLEVVKQFNSKKWKTEQAVLFFDTVANAFDQPDDLSVDILQGFTCSRVQTFTQTKIRGLIKACRRRAGRPKVVLGETQLTCMYNLVRKESPVDFESYHPDMLLYYNYEAINKTTCQAYFTQVGAADLSIFSSTLRGRRDLLWSKYLDCFGISGTSISKQNLTVLGNLACAANSTFITNSDPEILENLKNCSDLSDGQISAMEAVVMKGASKYGQPSTWNQKTLGDLGILPLYFSQTFWNSFKENDLGQFLKTFLKSMRERNTPKPQMKKLFKAIIRTVVISKRATCSKEVITDVIISNDAFPFGYNEDQFRNCLNADVVRDNLGSLCEKIEDSAFQRVILDKLNEISPNGLSEDQVQVLKSVSRNATTDEISKWNITKADTLAALMNANDGEWSSAQSKQIITKYLSANNNLTSTELSMVKGPNLCSLDTSTLSTILPESIRDADALNVSKCSLANKKALFTIANKAFPMTTVRASSVVLSTYQLIEPYLGGADLSYIRNLSSNNVSMSLATLINLDPSVIANLTVQDVKNLLGSNLPDLKTFENEPAVRTWISLQFQSELDKLDLGLTGGKADATTAVPTTITTVKTTVASSAATPGVGRSGWSVSLSILVLIFTIIKVEII